MIVRLRVLHGTLQDKHGHRQRPEVRIRGPRFVIGSAADCSMCCHCETISPYHCEIRIEPQGVVVRTLAREKGTFVNEQRVEREQVLRAGDHLRIGRLEFELLLDEPAPAVAPAGVSPDASPHDNLANELSDFLAEADEQERWRRLEHPEWRQLHLTPAAPAAAATPLATERHSGPAEKKGTSAKPPPGKLPPPPPSPEDLAKDSTEAAAIALRKLFSR
jgi:predicted component of type VI protein secretion system